MKDLSQNAFFGFTRKIGLTSFVLLFLTFAFASQAKADIVISEIYGGGGNGTGSATSPFATFRNDFVELYNNGTTSVDISGYSIQYASATGTGTFTVIPLSTATDTVIEPGTYFLIQLGGTTTMPAGAVNPTANVTNSLNISATAGKLALVSNITQLTGACPIPNAAVLDFVGYGTTANCSETAPAPPGSNVLSIQRNAAGLDTNNNSADFTAATPTPVAGGFGDLTITQSAPSTVTPGSNFDYTLTLNNSGSNTNLTNVSVNFTIPTGVTFVSAAGGNCTTMAVVGGVVQFRGCTITANTTNLTVTVTAPATAQTITSTGANVVIDPLTTITESSETNNNAPADAVTTVGNAPDTTPPTVTSIVRAAGSTNPTTSGSSIAFTVTFSEAVTGVDATDFALTTTGSIAGATITSVTGSGTTYTVTVNSGTGTGTIRLDAVDNDSIVDGANNPLGGTGASGGFTTGETFTTTAGPTAAMVNVGGRVTNAYGRGIFRALIRMTDGAGNVRSAYTTSFGYYNFPDVEVGQTLIFDVRAKRIIFTQPTQVVSLTEESTRVNFIAY